MWIVMQTMGSSIPEMDLEIFIKKVNSEGIGTRSEGDASSQGLRVERMLSSLRLLECLECFVRCMCLLSSRGQRASLL